MRSPYLAAHLGADATPPPTTFRQALGQFATGVTVVTALSDQGQPVGLTVNSFASLSLDPPLVLWSLQTNSKLKDHFGVGQTFAVNILAQHQAPVSQRFASSKGDKFANTPHTITEDGFVLLEGCLAYLECQTESAQVAGDHILLIAKVLRFALGDATPIGLDASPLLFFDGRYQTIGGPLA
jgi:flavin reductase (DIM6/NTAB) family NADH-FMN oxidoreductase RutF